MKTTSIYVLGVCCPEISLTILVVDNLSPFTPDILDCLGRLSMSCIYKKFSKVSDGDLAGCEKVVLSGRRRNSSEINAANSKIVKKCYGEGKPVLGICYGAEIIALTLGGSIKRMPSHVSGVTEVLLSRPSALAPGRDSLSVYESHAFCVARLPAGFQSLASSKYCEHEMFADAGRRIYGTQFHPEKSGKDGLDVLKNFATYV